MSSKDSRHSDEEGVDSLEVENERERQETDSKNRLLPRAPGSLVF
jgi:hypothetical protein